ncbi:MAG: anaerobic sulfite reductase subunit AsrB [bacterium]|nr:anaerobic sulfite reductase subunit AsrB [bacterium]
MVMIENIFETRPAKVLAIKKHTRSEWTFTLGLAIAQRPGQFMMVSLPGVGEAPISISRYDDSSFDLTIRNVGKVTSRIFDLGVGDVLQARGPYGESFPLDEFKGRHLLLIAGGSGVAAVKALADHYTGPGASELKKLDLLFGFRSPKHLLFRSELKAWHKQSNIFLTVDSKNDDDELWDGGIGFVVQFVKDVKDIGPDTRIVVVGPPLMIANTVRELLRHGVTEENIWLSFERHMKCGVCKCGHCRIGDKYVCADGPVFNYIEAKSLID